MPKNAPISDLYNGAAIADKLPRLRQALGLTDSADIAAFFDALNAELNLPRGLRAMGDRDFRPAPSAVRAALRQSLSSRRNSLPAGERGNSVTKLTSRGTL
ncbi:hypothetical protein XH92_12200 [Bradyrhizobium sp. CCBAU 53421]|nr:hypothetical protein XH92_12200 [Bradyrhizobium sp. CCBAU 53421]